ncbi:hypothetical protein L6452_32294 [Arctium lappa]|uniref:Uncharacterized protein n=1 Tax=Arctium lappa TaxID=4217 RepID=A0ACB8Z539_ARCLA|nr:hypothetical protein L6452_32294 [Arctium lappa]
MFDPCQRLWHPSSQEIWNIVSVRPCRRFLASLPLIWSIGFVASIFSGDFVLVGGKETTCPADLIHVVPPLLVSSTLMLLDNEQMVEAWCSWRSIYGGKSCGGALGESDTGTCDYVVLVGCSPSDSVQRGVLVVCSRGGYLSEVFRICFGKSSL